MNTVFSAIEMMNILKIQTFQNSPFLLSFSSIFDTS